MRRWGPLVVAFAALAPAAGAQPGAAFTPEMMLRVAEFVRGSEPVVSPAGDLVAYATSDVADETNIRAPRPSGFLWVVPADGSAPPRAISAGGEPGQEPVWAPDGRSLAFLRTRGGESHLAVWDVGSGRSRDIGPSLGTDRTRLPLGPLGPRWSADSRRILLPVPEPPPPPAAAPRVRVLSSSDPVVPGDARFTDTRRWRLVLVDAAGGAGVAVTTEPVALRGFDFSPAGNRVLYRAVAPATLGRFRREVVETWAVSTAGGAPPRRVLPQRKPAWITLSPDGGDLLFPEGGTLYAQALDSGAVRAMIHPFPARTDPPVAAPGHELLALLASRPGTGPPDDRMYSILRPVQDVVLVDLAARTSRTLTDPSRSDELSDLAWSADGRTLFYRTVDPGTYRETIVRWRAGQRGPLEVVAGDEAFEAPSASSDGGLLVFTAQSATRPGDGFAIGPDGRRRRLTDLNPWLAGRTFVAPELFEFHSADGAPLKGLLFRPPGAGASRRVPVVTYVYEKLTPQKNRFNAEAQLHVSHGYAYLMPDVLVRPEFTGDSFVKSVVPAVNAVRAMGFTTGRFGITGGSFGGYAGLYLISHVDIFAAAVLRAPPSEFFSTWGDGRDRDIWTIETGQARTGGSPWEVPERYVSNSPFFAADEVRTPVLILHGEKDFTVPFQQGEMMFSALRALGRTAELAVYREGDHSIVRGSRSDFLDFYARTLEWWKRYLGVAGAASPSGSKKHP